MPWYTYILRCRDASYYDGYSNDVDSPLFQHQQGLIKDCYTHNRRPVRLMLVEEYPTRAEAFRRERQLKGWSRAKKEALISGNLTRLQVLSRSYTDTIAAKASSSVKELSS